jgi:type II secretory pathway pseudopilin PulG
MAASSQAVNKAIQFILAIVIVGLGYFLYESITEPYEAVERQREITRETRDRMQQVRGALSTYRQGHNRFPGSLDSLHHFVLTDSLMVTKADSIFGAGFRSDSLIYSPRTGKKFEYALNDTSSVNIYLLSDPDSNDRIGSLTPDVTLLNAASWE